MTDEDLSIGESTAELLKEMVEEIRTLRQRVESLESQNTSLVKAVDDPETMMKKAGWLKAETPQPEEVFDPLQREEADAFISGFDSGSISKSHDEELRDWQDMENALPASTDPSSLKYR